MEFYYLVNRHDVNRDTCACTILTRHTIGNALVQIHQYRWRIWCQRRRWFIKRIVSLAPYKTCGKVSRFRNSFYLYTIHILHKHVFTGNQVFVLILIYLWLRHSVYGKYSFVFNTLFFELLQKPNFCLFKYSSFKLK